MSARQVAIVGAGIGAQHFLGFSKIPDLFAVHTICELDAARAKPMLDASPNTRLVDSLDAVFADPEIDIVDICLPPHLHFDACKRAMEAGKDVICEKPLVSSVADADRLAAVSAETGKQVFPVFQYRYGKGASQLRALIDNGVAGKAFVGSLETHWNRDAAYYAVDWRGTWVGEQGGAILGHAIHIHDWISFALGPVAQVFAHVATRVNDIEVEDCASISLKMESGALVTSSVTLGAANDTSRLRLCFENLTAESGDLPYAPAEGTWRFLARGSADQGAIDAVSEGVGDVPTGYVGLFTAISDALDGKTGREVTLADARRSLEFVSAVYESARSGQPVNLPMDAQSAYYHGWLPDA